MAVIPGSPLRKRKQFPVDEVTRHNASPKTRPVPWTGPCRGPQGCAPCRKDGFERRVPPSRHLPRAKLDVDHKGPPFTEGCARRGHFGFLPRAEEVVSTQTPWALRELRRGASRAHVLAQKKRAWPTRPTRVSASLPGRENRRFLFHAGVRRVPAATRYFITRARNGVGTFPENQVALAGARPARLRGPTESGGEFPARPGPRSRGGIMRPRTRRASVPNQTAAQTRNGGRLLRAGRDLSEEGPAGHRGHDPPVSFDGMLRLSFV